MNCLRFWELARELLRLPTAAYHEHFVVGAIREFVAGREFGYQEDRYGNIRLSYNGLKGDTVPTLVATAHLDHPALGWVSTIAKHEHAFERLGRLPIERILGAPVRIYNTNSGPVEYVRASVFGEIDDDKLDIGVRVDHGQPTELVGPGSFAIWDLPEPQRRGFRIHAGACDDLAGVAVGLCWLEQLSLQRCRESAMLLLTRAEEIGFGGMLAAAKGETLDPCLSYVNIECSSTLSGATLGEGPVIRVGDRRSVFDSGVAGALAHIADCCRADIDGFHFQRKLMDSGTCEATVLQHAGYATGAVALPLGNYHNLGRGKLQREVIDARDAEMLVDLLTALTTHDSGIKGARKRADESLTQLLEGYHRESEPRLLQSVPRPL